MGTTVNRGEGESRGLALPVIFDGPRIDILDTDRIINHLAERVRLGVLHLLVTTEPLSRGRAYASRHVYREMYLPDNLGNVNKFEKLARQSQVEGWGRPADAFQRVFESEYLPVIRFVEMGNLFLDHEWSRGVAERDQKDVPTGQLAVLLEGMRRIVYSHDGDLRGPGLAPPDLQIVFAAWKEIELANSTVGGAYYAGVSITVGVDQGTKAIAGVLKVPQWLVLLVAAALVTWALMNPERRQKARTLATPLGRMVIEIAERGAAAQSALLEASLATGSDLGVVQSVAKLLCLTPDQGLQVSQIIEQLPMAGYQDELEPEVLVRVLRTAPCFIATEESRWQVGEILVGPDADIGSTMDG